MIAATAAGRGSSLIAQLVLAWLLSKDDFGIYFIAISVSLLALALRDGGVRHVLVQEHSRYEELLGPVFWMTAALNLAAGILLAAIAPAAAAIYEEPAVARVLIVIAISIPLGTPAAVLSARLNIELRFREIAAVSVWASIARFGGAIALAAAGLGPLSFVLPLPLVALLEWALLRRYNGERPWTHPLRFDCWPGIFRQARWVMLGSLAIGVWNMGNYFLVGLFVSAAVVGVYAFSNQLVQQVGVLISANVNQVLFPAFARLLSEPERKRQAVIRSMQQVLLVTAPACALLGAVFPALEQAIWQGRWRDAHAPVAIIAALFPPTCVLPVTIAVQQARGEFRSWALMVLGMAAAMMAAGALAARLWGTAPAIAAASTAVMAVVSIAYACAALRAANIRARDVHAAVAPVWILALLIGGALAAADRFALGEAHPVFRVFCIAGAYGVLFLLAARVILASQLRDAAALLPARARARLSLVLPEEVARSG